MHSAGDILQATFGYEAFRPPQDEIIETIIAGGDALVLMPTGGGKSLCYQIPALVRPGCGVVISPLIALMKDQVDALRQLGVKASYLNSTLDPFTAQAIEDNLTVPSGCGIFRNDDEFDAHDRSRPFFLFLSLYAPHTPLRYQTETYREPYRDSQFSCFPDLPMHPEDWANPLNSIEPDAMYGVEDL